MVSEPGGDRLTSSGGQRTVVREALVQRRVGEEGFRWRGEDVSRVEAFTDAVFAFAVTLLVVSLEVPKTFDELLVDMRGFFAFAICFALLLFVYPLKFVFTLWMDQLFGFSENEMIEASQVPLLMFVYGAGFVTIQLVFVLMYLRAYSLRDTLGLGAHELSITREEIQGYLLNVAVGLASIAIAVFGGVWGVFPGGGIFLLVFPLQTINGRVMRSRRRRDEGTRTAARADDEGKGS